MKNNQIIKIFATKQKFVFSFNIYSNTSYFCLIIYIYIEIGVQTIKTIMKITKGIKIGIEIINVKM